MNTLTVTIKRIGFTIGSMGQQNVTAIKDDGSEIQIQMWTDLKSPLWTKSGEKCIIELLPDTNVYYGSGYMILKNRAQIVQKLTN